MSSIAISSIAFACVFGRAMLVVMISWLIPLFIGFGLLARPNGTVITSLAISALSVSSAIFLILELFSPYTGVIKVSSAPFRAALMQLGK
jgi:hypothetical protein